MTPEKQKIYITAYLLWFFLGIFGAHRFYMQYYFTATFYLLTLGVVGLGWLLDVGLIPSLIDEWEIKKNGGNIMDIPVDVPDVPETPYSPVQQDLVSDRNQEIFTPRTPQPDENPFLPPPPEEVKPPPTLNPPEGVKHVIYVLMKDRSFDQMLGALGNTLGVDGADAIRCNIGSSGVPIFQTQCNYIYNQQPMWNDHDAVMSQIGTMKDMSGFIATCQKLDEKHKREFYAGRWEEVMGFFPLNSLPALHTLAQHYTVCDKWFSSVPADSIPNRFFALTGTSQGRVYMPQEEIFAPSQPTIFDRLEENDVTWNVYHDGFATSLLLPKQWDSERVAKYRPMSKFYLDCQGPANHFPEFAFIEPKYSHDGNDDSAPHAVMNGQQFLADIYNAVRGNEELWNSSLIVVVYDQHGGFYDHVSPPSSIAPDEHQDEFSFDQLGVRVPALLISPYVDQSVDSTTYDHTSLLAYLSSKWSLGPLGDRVASVDSFEKRIRKEPRVNCLPRIDGIPHDDTVRSGHDGLPFTNFQRDSYTLMRKLAENIPDLSHLTRECDSWAEFESLFNHVLAQHQRH